MIPQIPPSPRRLLGLGLLSGAILFAEVGLTRLFSTLYYPPAVFAILTLAVLGIGLGAGAAAWRPVLRSAQILPIQVALAAVGLLAVCITGLMLTGPGVRWLALLLGITPFAFSGMALANLFGQRPADSPRLYLADLAGAGVGALAVVPLLNWIGLVDGLLAISAVLGIAALILNPGSVRIVPLAAVGVAVTMLVANLASGWLDLDPASLPTEKPISQVLFQGGELAAGRWDAFARTDLVDPGDGTPYELFIDGAAGSVMPPAGDNPALWRDIGFFPFATEQPRRVFVIGPGGGLDVWFGLQVDVEEIVAVEVNPASVDLVREFAAYNGDLYAQPAVRVAVDEGRSVLEREETLYDLIFLSQVVTLAAERSGYALVENSTYTVEAFRTYLDHLQEGGQIGLKLYDEATLTRALATALEALGQREASSDAEALLHVVTLLDADADPPIPLLLVRKRAYSRDEALSIGAVARQVGFTPLYLPHVLAQPPLDAVLGGDRTFDNVIAQAESDLFPTTDDRPFFFQFEPGLPGALYPLLWGVGAGLPILALLLLRIPQAEGGARQRWFYLYFAALGAGFMLVEIGIIQQSRLFLGHPTWAVTVVLASLLLFGGLGSGLAGRIFGKIFSPLPPLLVVCATLLWLLFWPGISRNLISLGQIERTLVVIVLLLPLALCLGMPFPLGLRALRGSGDREVALAWAVNGLMSVTGTVAAMALAILLGYTLVLGAAAGVYLAAAVAAHRVSRT